MKSEHQAILAAALDYAAHGWPVFPCHPGTKRPLIKGDHDPNTGTEIPGTGGLTQLSQLGP
jgi:putative DNA primase/helicase